MKNIHILPTDKEPVKGDLLLRHIWKDTPNECISWRRYDDTITIDGVVQYTTLNGSFRDITSSFKVQNIYITSDEEIKEGDWYIDTSVFKENIAIDRGIYQMKYFKWGIEGQGDCKKIILTTDQDLIKDGVQAVEEDFLNWFIKNPSCEKVEIRNKYISQLNKPSIEIYKIIIPKEESKQETLEESMNQNGYLESDYDKIWREGVEFGAKWQQERMYSVVDEYVNDVIGGCNLRFEEWFEQIKTNRV